MQQFLTDLALTHHMAASTQNQALSALVFLYKAVLHQDIGWIEDVIRAKKPKRLPVVLTRAEVKAVLRHVSGHTWLMTSLRYGAGLRLMECLRLRVKDVDFAYHGITVRNGKGAQAQSAAGLVCSLDVPLPVSTARGATKHVLRRARRRDDECSGLATWPSTA